MYRVRSINIEILDKNGMKVDGKKHTFKSKPFCKHPENVYATVDAFVLNLVGENKSAMILSVSTTKGKFVYPINKI